MTGTPSLPIADDDWKDTFLNFDVIDIEYNIHFLNIGPAKLDMLPNTIWDASTHPGPGGVRFNICLNQTCGGGGNGGGGSDGDCDNRPETGMIYPRGTC